jgi:hypothetical protein
MEKHFLKVKNYLQELEYSIISESEPDGVFVVENEPAGIKNLVIACADPILIMEQYLCEIKTENINTYKSMLQKNRDIIHGALALDESGRKVIFRDTLQIENLDLNELEGSLNSLSLLLSEYTDDIIKFSVA